MPEGAEVMKYVDLFKPHLNTIIKITGRMELQGHFNHVTNHGKMMIFSIGNTVMTLQPGLTGSFGINRENAKLTIVFPDSKLYFHDPINLAHYNIGVKWEKLGYDCTLNFYKNPPPLVKSDEQHDKERFIKKLMTSRAPLYKNLLKQEFCSGSGNYLRSEAIRACNFDPFIMCPLTRQQSELMIEKLVEITRLQYNNNYTFKVYKVGKKIKDGNRTYWY